MKNNHRQDLNFLGKAKLSLSISIGEFHNTPITETADEATHTTKSGQVLWFTESMDWMDELRSTGMEMDWLGWDGERDAAGPRWMVELKCSLKM